MKNPDRNTVTELDELPNIGKAIAGQLASVGVTSPRQLVGACPFDLHRKLCEARGGGGAPPVDPCVIDVIMSAVHFMEGGEPKPWWEFTARRKSIVAKEEEKLGDERK